MAKQAMNGNSNGKTRKRAKLNGVWTLLAGSRCEANGKVYKFTANVEITIITCDDAHVTFQLDDITFTTSRDNLI